MLELVIIFFAIALLKAVRDTDEWCFHKSVFAGRWFWEWLHLGSERFAAFDLWHLADGAIVCGLFVYAYWLRFPGLPWWRYALALAVFWAAFYRVFNFLYHFALRQPRHRDWWQRRKF